MLKVMFLRCMLCLYVIDQTLLVNGADFEIQLWFSLHSILLDNVFDMCTTQASPSTMCLICVQLRLTFYNVFDMCTTQASPSTMCLICV